MTNSLFPDNATEDQYDPERPNAGQYSASPVVKLPTNQELVDELSAPISNSTASEGSIAIQPGSVLKKAAAILVPADSGIEAEKRPRSTNTLVDAINIRALVEKDGLLAVAELLDVHINTARKYATDGQAPVAAEMLCKYVYEERFILPFAPVTDKYIMMSPSDKTSTILQVAIALGASFTRLDV